MDRKNGAMRHVLFCLLEVCGEDAAGIHGTVIIGSQQNDFFQSAVINPLTGD
jgi:hypothetical protein